jgi:gamma-glutamylcyclotransferase (GGCT)/AIG2-like uncharacterized protein YtfP
MARADIRLFAYGSLMKGEPNHALVSGAEFAGVATTAPAYKLVDLGPYPALVAGGALAVEGEVYVIDPKQRFAIDVKHEVPVLFQRVMIALDDGTSAETYVMREDQVRGRRRLFHGDWRKRFAPRPRADHSGAFVRAAKARFKPQR